MKSKDILERKYRNKHKSEDKDLSKRINLLFYDIFYSYENLNDDSIENIRIFVDTFFSKLRPTKYKDKFYREKLNDYLYPDISFVGLAHLYSYDGYIQYSFLLKVYSEITKELNKNIKNKEKIK